MNETRATMLARQRQKRILEALRASGGVRVSDLTEELNVSYMTVRRDIDALAEQGLVEKVHGGATVTGTAASQLSAETTQMSAAGASDDAAEGIAAFAAKRTPTFHGS